MPNNTPMTKEEFALWLSRSTLKRKEFCRRRFVDAADLFLPVLSDEGIILHWGDQVSSEDIAFLLGPCCHD